MAQHNITGTEGEKIAVQFLLNAQYEIVEKNYRYQKAEVDIIAKKESTLVFIEVKTRTTNYFGQPYEHVTDKKQQLMAFAANAYIQANNWKGESRFDVISIIMENNKTSVEHIPDAFYPFE